MYLYTIVPKDLNLNTDSIDYYDKLKIQQKRGFFRWKKLDADNGEFVANDGIVGSLRHKPSIDLMTRMVIIIGTIAGIGDLAFTIVEIIYHKKNRNNLLSKNNSKNKSI